MLALDSAKNPQSYPTEASGWARQRPGHGGPKLAYADLLQGRVKSALKNRARVMADYDDVWLVIKTCQLANHGYKRKGMFGWLSKFVTSNLWQTVAATKSMVSKVKATFMTRFGTKISL